MNSKDKRLMKLGVWGVLLSTLVLFGYMTQCTLEEQYEAIAIFMAFNVLWFLAVIIYDLHTEED